jgi:hypothetical protein
MNKKILFIIFCGALIFLPIIKVGATQVYVGVKISSAVAPGYDANGNSVFDTTEMDNNWCLPVGTDLAILNTTSSCSYLTDGLNGYYLCDSYCTSSCIADVATSAKYITTTSPTCPGSTIWSGLLNLATNTSYKVYLYTPSFCSGIVESYCYQKWTTGKNCNETCAHYGMTPMTSGTNCYGYNNSSCNAIKSLKGGTCSTCVNGSYSYYSSTACYYNSSAWGSCTWSDANYTRVCACNYTNTPTSFALPFTSSF